MLRLRSPRDNLSIGPFLLLQSSTWTFLSNSTGLLRLRWWAAGGIDDRKQRASILADEGILILNPQPPVRAPNPFQQTANLAHNWWTILGRQHAEEPDWDFIWKGAVAPHHGVGVKGRAGDLRDAGQAVPD